MTQRRLMRKGRLSTALEGVETRWDRFSDDSDDIQAVLFDEFGPMLEDFTKASGVTKNPAKASPTMLFDPRKNQAIDVAEGLEAWLTSASEGAQRYYAEMRSALELLGGVSLDWQFGVSDLTQPDAFSRQGALEGKRTQSILPAAVDALIREARAQQTQRVTHPSNQPYSAWRIGIEIDADNPWPYTQTELNARGVAANEVPQLVSSDPTGRLPQPAAARAQQRNLTPQKGKKHPAVPFAQLGQHQIWVRWPGYAMQHIVTM